MATSSIAQSSHWLFLSSFLLLTLSPSLAQPSRPGPNLLVLPVDRDATTLQYVTRISQRTPLVPIRLVVDLGGRHLWVDCEDPGYVSSTFRSPRCGSAQCSLARTNGCSQCFSPARPGCNNNTCFITPENSVTRISDFGQLASDVVSINSLGGGSITPVDVPQFLFACGPTSLLDGLANGVKGMAGLGRTIIALPSQFSSAFNFSREFTICLPSSTNSNGSIFLGAINSSESFLYSPLLNNSVSLASSYVTGEPSYEYFIDVNAIYVEDTLIPLNSSLLTISSNGNGGTKISTINPYTVLETSIFKAITEEYISRMAAVNVTRVDPVKPFEVCFSSENIEWFSSGPEAAYIYLTRQNKQPLFTILPSDSLVRVNNNTLCLGFIDGGATARTAIVLGAYQLQDKLVHFDLAKSRVGFSGRLNPGKSCNDFNITGNP